MATVDQYRHQLAALLPPGMALTAEPDSELDILLQKLAALLAPVASTATQLQQDALPATTDQLLDAWETAFALPDELAAAAPTRAERLARLVSRVADMGGARIPRYLQIAQQLGYENPGIERLKPFTANSGCRDRIWGPDARFGWIMRVSGNAPALPIEVLTALIAREAPAISIPMILKV